MSSVGVTRNPSMSTNKRIGLSGGKLLVLVLIALFPAIGQGMQNVIHPLSNPVVF